MSTQISESIIYSAPPNGIVFWNQQNSNPSGLGVSQCGILVTQTLIGAGESFVVTIQAPRPAPLLYFATGALGDTISIFTPEQNPVTLTPITNGATGFNGQYFQPNPGQKFNIIYKSSIAQVVGATILIVQAVVENTLSQYIDLSSIQFPNGGMCKIPPVMRMVVTQNITSAIPNTLCFDYTDYPCDQSLVSIVTFFGLLDAQAIIMYGPYGAMAASSGSSQFKIVGGQMGSITRPGGKGHLFTGSVFLSIANIGVVSLPATLFSVSIPTIFDHTTFGVEVGAPEANNAVMTKLDTISAKLDVREYHAVTPSFRQDNSDIIDHVSSMFARIDHASLKSGVDGVVSLAANLKRSVQELNMRNEAAHEKQNAKLDAILFMLKTLTSETDEEERGV